MNYHISRLNRYKLPLNVIHSFIVKLQAINFNKLCSNITSIINPAQNGESLRCIRGRANPRQPNSSTGPLIIIRPMAISSDGKVENGKGSENKLPLQAEPA